LTQSLELYQQERLLELSAHDHKPHLLWHGLKLGQPDWSDDSHSIAFSLYHPTIQEHLYVIFNADWKPLTFELPTLEPGNGWHRIVDTSLPSPEDFQDPQEAPRIQKAIYLAEARSSIVLISLPTKNRRR